MCIGEFHFELESLGYSLYHVSDVGGDGGHFCFLFSLGEPHYGRLNKILKLKIESTLNSNFIIFLWDFNDLAT